MPFIDFECATCGASPGELCRSVVPRFIRSRAGVRAPIIKKIHIDRRPVCYRAPLSPHTACGGGANNDTDDWKRVTCSKCLEKQYALALNHAHYYGKEFEANPGSSLREYLDDCAYHFGVDTFRDLPADKKSAIRKAFDGGRAIERRAARS